MLYDLGLAWRNIRHRPIETIIPVLVVSFAIALSVAVIALSQAAEEGIVQASDPFGVLVIGAAGSGQELVLSSILLQGNPIGNIPYAVYEDLHHDERVQLAVPLAFGDNVGGSRVIGTNHHFFDLRTSASAPPAFQLHEGRLFEDPHMHDHADHDDHDHTEGEVHDEHHEHDEDEAHADHDDHEHAEGEVHDDHHEHDHDHANEAVLGWNAYTRLGLNIGDQFVATHGVGHGIAENVHHDHHYTVVGILKPSGTAYDNAVYVSVESVWDVHGHAEESPSSLSSLAAAANTEPTADEITAILVLPTGFIEQNQLAQEFYLNPTLQAAFPGQELGNILHLLRQGQEVLNVIGYLVLGIAGLTVFLSMYSAINARRSAIAIMRGLGGSRWTIIRMILFETLLISVLGSIIGRILGYGIAHIIAQAITTQATIPMPVSFLPELELLLWGLALGVGILAGLVPALMAYRVNVIENLFPA